MKRVIILTGLFIGSGFLMAGGFEGGNGGWGCEVVSGNNPQEVKKITLMDLFEGEEQGFIYPKTDLVGTLPLGESLSESMKMDFIQKGRQVAEVLASSHQKYFVGIQKAYDLVFAKYKILSEGANPTVKREDFSHNFKCDRPVNVAFNPNKERLSPSLEALNYDPILFSRNRSELMEIFNLFATFSHEALVLFTAVPENGNTDYSNFARAMNARVLAAVFGKGYTVNDFKHWIKGQVGSLEYSKIGECEIYDVNKQLRGIVGVPFPVILRSDQGHVKAHAATVKKVIRYDENRRPVFAQISGVEFRDNGKSAPTIGEWDSVDSRLVQRSTVNGSVLSASDKKVWGHLNLEDSTIRDGQKNIIGYFMGCHSKEDNFLPYPYPLGVAASAAYALLWKQGPFAVSAEPVCGFDEATKVAQPKLSCPAGYIPTRVLRRFVKQPTLCRQQSTVEQDYSYVVNFDYFCEPK